MCMWKRKEEKKTMLLFCSRRYSLVFHCIQDFKSNCIKLTDKTVFQVKNRTNVNSVSMQQHRKLH